MTQAKAIDGMGSYQVAFWFGFNLLDLVLSIVSLNYGGIEAMPIPSWILRTSGLAGLALYKLGMAAFVLLLLAGIRKLKVLPWLNIGLGGICIYYAVLLIKTFSG